MRDETESGLIQPIGGEDPEIGWKGVNVTVRWL